MKRRMQIGCIAVLLYCIVCSIIVEVTGRGLFTQVGDIGTLHGGRRAPQWVGHALDIVTAPVQVTVLWPFLAINNMCHDHPIVGARILPDLNVKDVAIIECDGRKLASQQDGAWFVDAYDGYPADLTKIEGFLCALTNLTVWKVEEDTNICHRVMYNPLSIVLKDVDGNVFADLELGDKHGVDHSGFVESVFVPDGRYMSFMGEIVLFYDRLTLSCWPKETKS